MPPYTWLRVSVKTSKCPRPAPAVLTSQIAYVRATTAWALYVSGSQPAGSSFCRTPAR